MSMERNKRLHIRMTVRELEVLQQKAREELLSLSAWVRQTLLKLAKK